MSLFQLSDRKLKKGNSAQNIEIIIVQFLYSMMSCEVFSTHCRQDDITIVKCY